MTINQDKAGFDTITPFVKKHDLNGITHYWDKYNIEYTKLRMQGLPMSFLLDVQGNLIATIEGRVDWLGKDVAGLIEEKPQILNTD
jgi:hypothetical protein